MMERRAHWDFNLIEAVKTASTQYGVGDRVHRQITKEARGMSGWQARTPAFSNGTEWEMWQAQWCDDCLWDVNDGCPLIEKLLLHEPVPQVVEKHGLVRCTEWRPDE